MAVQSMPLVLEVAPVLLEMEVAQVLLQPRKRLMLLRRVHKTPLCTDASTAARP
jgi:hypothetical protein